MSKIPLLLLCCETEQMVLNLKVYQNEMSEESSKKNQYTRFINASKYSDIIKQEIKKKKMFPRIHAFMNYAFNLAIRIVISLISF